MILKLGFRFIKNFVCIMYLFKKRIDKMEKNKDNNIQITAKSNIFEVTRYVRKVTCSDIIKRWRRLLKIVGSLLKPAP